MSDGREIRVGRCGTVSPTAAIVMHMPTLEIDKALLAKAQELTGLRCKAAVLNAGLEALIGRESGRQLIALGATEREIRAAPRRRQRAARGGA